MCYFLVDKNTHFIGCIRSKGLFQLKLNHYSELSLVSLSYTSVGEIIRLLWYYFPIVLFVLRHFTK